MFSAGTDCCHDTRERVTGATYRQGAKGVVRAWADGMIDKHDDQTDVVATVATTQTLPRDPAAGEEHRVSARGAFVTVAGGRYMIASAAGDVASVSIPRGETVLFVFSTDKVWFQG